jgi:hypothetical protein
MQNQIYRSHNPSTAQIGRMWCIDIASRGDRTMSALRSLRINECSALESLPQSIKRLTALQKLFVFGCRGLTRCYELWRSGRWLAPYLLLGSMCVYIGPSPCIVYCVYMYSWDDSRNFPKPSSMYDVYWFGADNSMYLSTYTFWVRW